MDASLILLIVALVCFALATFGVSVRVVNLTALGLFFFAATFLPF